MGVPPRLPARSPCVRCQNPASCLQKSTCGGVASTVDWGWATALEHPSCDLKRWGAQGAVVREKSQAIVWQGSRAGWEIAQSSGPVAFSFSRCCSDPSNGAAESPRDRGYKLSPVFEELLTSALPRRSRRWRGTA